jgi:nucleoside-diphosphate-sugar epimerase
VRIFSLLITRLKIFKDCDLLKSEGFEIAMNNCQGVFHVACPYPTDISDAESTLIKPGVEGTENIIKIALRTDSVEVFLF